MPVKSIRSVPPFSAKWREIVVVALIAIGYASLAYVVSHALIGMGRGDTFVHATYLDSVGLRNYVSQSAYPGWHVVLWVVGKLLPFASLAQSACIANALFASAAAVAVFVAVKTILKDMRRSLLTVAVVTVVLLFVCSIYIPGFSSTPYRYAGSPTIWHNPTYLAVRPFAVLSCLLLFDMAADRRANFGSCLGYGALTVIALFFKPSYAQVQIPALVVFLFIDFARRRDLQFVGRIALSVVPALCVMAAQFYFLMFTSTGGGGGIGIGPFYLLLNSDKPILLPAILLLAFPVYSMIVLRKDIFEIGSPYLFFVAMLIVGYVEANCVYELGERMADGNFAWGYYLALFLFWVFILPLFAKKMLRGELKRSIAIVGCVLVLLHFASGVYYISELLSGMFLF